MFAHCRVLQLARCVPGGAKGAAGGGKGDKMAADARARPERAGGRVGGRVGERPEMAAQRETTAPELQWELGDGDGDGEEGEPQQRCDATLLVAVARPQRSATGC
jgi:hypothetical protein